MKKQQFIELVKQELIHLKQNATKKEIGRLDFDSFRHKEAERCIYGQMTGDCNSKRAIELYPKKFDHIGGTPFVGYRTFKEQSFVEGNFYTPLEKYLYMVKSNTHKKIIDYLKGELNGLEFIK